MKWLKNSEKEEKGIHSFQAEGVDTKWEYGYTKK